MRLRCRDRGDTENRGRLRYSAVMIQLITARVKLVPSGWPPTSFSTGILQWGLKHVFEIGSQTMSSIGGGTISSYSGGSPIGGSPGELYSLVVSVTV